MAAPVYSTQFLALAAPAPGLYTYTVPAGHIAVVRDVSGTLYNAAAGLAAYCDASGVIFAVFVSTGQNSPAVDWRGRIVIPPGGLLRAQLLVANVELILSGYLFTSP